jgi:hypothetical protein
MREASRRRSSSRRRRSSTRRRSSAGAAPDLQAFYLPHDDAHLLNAILPHGVFHLPSDAVHPACQPPIQGEDGWRSSFSAEISSEKGASDPHNGDPSAEVTGVLVRTISNRRR